VVAPVRSTTVVSGSRRPRAPDDADLGQGGGGGPGRGDRRGRSLARRVSALLGEALASDDAECGGLRADEVLAHPDTALALLGAPESWPAARHAVVQRYGRVGALLVAGYEGRAAPGGAGEAGNPPELEQLLEGFAAMDAHDIEDLLARLGPAGSPLDRGVGEEAAAARRRLEAAYAVAARDGTEGAHRAYMEALDRVMRLAARRLAS
jgi:hypothetical protein